MLFTLASTYTWKLQANAENVIHDNTKSAHYICSQDDQNLKKVYEVRVTKKTWRYGELLFATYRSPGQNWSVDIDIKVTGERNDYLKWTWRGASHEIEGSYRCVINGFDPVSNSQTIHFTSSVKVLWPLDDSEWPGGNYFLPTPLTGCPSDDELKETKISLFETFKEKHKAFILTVNTFKKTFKFKYCAKNKFIPIKHSPSWPAGSYCIGWFVTESCPDNFKVGFVSCSTLRKEYRMDFCCRNDGNPDTPIKLPKATPFYLFR